MFKFQTAFDRAESQGNRFASQYDKDHAGEPFDRYQFDDEYEKLGILTPCRKCGYPLENGRDEYDGSYATLEPLFQSRSGNGYRSGQHYRFERDVGLSGFCESCCHDLVPWFQKLADVCEVMKVINYLERSIRCQRTNNPVEKSKLLDNLGKCLSTPPSGF